MTVSINQILVFCLIAVLIVFLVEMAILVKYAIPLMQKSKALVENGNQAVDNVKGKTDEISNGLTGAMNSIAEDASPALKVLGGVAAGLTAVNSVAAAGKGLAIRSGILAAIAGSRDAKRARKEIRRSRRVVKQMRKQARVERKLAKKMRKINKKAGNI